MEDTILDEFLARTHIDKKNNHFIIGGFEPGVTVFKQQVRALNLLYAIHQKEILKKGSSIAIIGAGISGVTAAAGALILGYEVYLFEKNSVLCHLQRGCETRWLHPHIYDWPIAGSESPYAGLPLLTWKAGITSNVVEQILDSFEKLVQRRENKKFHRHKNCIPIVKGKRVTWNGSSNSVATNDSRDFQSVIFCVGYGIEKLVEDNTTFSYWRNDSVNQPVLTKPNKKERISFLVSGTGDGGLIDTLRVRLRNFNQGKIVEEIFPEPETHLKKELISIVSRWKTEKKAGDIKKDWLNSEFNKLQKRGLFKQVDDRLKKRLRKDTQVCLNGRTDITQIFSLSSASLLNNLLVHRLWRKDSEFDYKQGDCHLSSKRDRGESPLAPVKVKIDGKEMQFDQVIFRQGTEREKVLEAAGCYEAVKALDKVKSTYEQPDTSIRIWSAGWWENNIAVSGKAVNIETKVPTEFVPPATIAVATPFITTLSNIIKRETDLDFRLTLHRVIKIQGEEFFQQIVRYAGTRTEGRVGRILRTSTGTAGLACRLGKPVIVTRDKHFQKIWDRLNLYDIKFKPRKMDDKVKCLLACPFFAPEKGENDKPKYVSLILFVDSNENKFLNENNEKVLKIIYDACQGFVNNLEEMKENDELYFISPDFKGREIKPSEEDEKIVRDFKSVDSENEVFKGYIEGLTFKTIDSFDIELRD